MDFFTEYHPDSWAIWPALSVMRAECECCGDPAGFAIALSFLCFSIGLSFAPGHSGS